MIEVIAMCAGVSAAVLIGVYTNIKKVGSQLELSYRVADQNAQRQLIQLRHILNHVRNADPSIDKDLKELLAYEVTTQMNCVGLNPVEADEMLEARAAAYDKLYR